MEICAGSIASAAFFSRQVATLGAWWQLIEPSPPLFLKNIALAFKEGAKGIAGPLAFSPQTDAEATAAAATTLRPQVDIPAADMMVFTKTDTALLVE